MPHMTKRETYGFMVLGVVLMISSLIMLKTIDPHNDTLMGLTVGLFISSICVYFIVLVYGDIYK